jgi:hypothetical protein
MEDSAIAQERRTRSSESRPVDSEEIRKGAIIGYSIYLIRL